MQHTGIALTLAWLVSAGAAAAPSPQQVKWIQDAAVPIRSVDIADTEYSDLAPLARAIGDARIVQLGEATHGDGTAFLAKARLIRFLHEKMGFDVLLWESPMLGARLMDAGMRDPRKSAYEAGKDNIFGVWVESAQVQGLLDYIKQSQATARPIITAGVDCRLGSQEHKEKTVPQYLIGFFDRADPALLDKREREEIVRICKTVEYGDYFAKPGPRNLDMSVMMDLVAYLDRNRAQVRRVAATEEIEFVRQLLLSEIGYEKMCEQVGREKESGPGISRDMIMGANLVWQATRMFPDRKIIVWAHNFHIMESNYLAQTAAALDRFEAQSADKGPMGHVAARRLGTEVYTIGFLGASGSHDYANQKESAPTPIPPAPEGTLDWYLNQAPAEHSFLDLQSLPPNHWLREPMPARFYFWEESTTVWPRIFDAVFFSRTIEPSTRRR